MLYGLQDFTFICGVAINYGHSAEVFDASGGLLVIVALTACATRMMERTRREKWWTQCLLDEELKRQLQRSVDSEKMVRFLSHEGTPDGKTYSYSYPSLIVKIA